MSNNPTISALRAALESEIDRVAKDTFGREYSKWNKEEKRPFNYDESFRHGHEAATERLMGIIEKAVEMAESISSMDISGYDVYDAADIMQEDAREFLTTIADASGEMNKELK